MALKILRNKTLVSPSWLMRALDSGDKMNILDCSWHLPNAGRNQQKDFEEKHIPGAHFFDIEECSDKTTDLPHMRPNIEMFQKYVGSLGIDNKSFVVVYDNHPQFAVFSAPRVWWTFRSFGHTNIAVLEGGLPKWISEGFPVTSEITPAVEVEYVAEPKPMYLKNYEDIVKNIEDKVFQLVDARPSGRFNGTAPEPRADIKPGCILNSKNVPFSELLNTEDRTIKSTDELINIFDQAGVDINAALTGTCGTGVSASVLALAAFVCGSQNMDVYDGSWTEWYQRAPAHLKVNVPSN